MKYLSSQPFSSPAATKSFRDNYPIPDPPKSTEVIWEACVQCGAPVRPHETTCPCCGYQDQTRSNAK
jgi:hypothetical protein